MIEGRFEVGPELARGGGGVVYRGHDHHTNEPVAIKVLVAHGDANDLERFLREGDVARRLDHPNTISVIALGLERGRPYLVLELVEGEDLAKRLERGPLPIEDAVQLALDLAGAVEAAHALGVVHRDLKPQNVLFKEGRPLLTDFGVARVADARTLTQTGELLGTPTYMAPEQIRADRDLLGPATDVYGLGGILYACLTGGSPFRGHGVIETLDHVLRSPPPPPRGVRPEVSPALERVVLRALAKEPSERYPSARAFADALRGAQGADASARLPWALAGAAALACVALAAGIFSGGGDSAPRSSASPPTPTPSATPARDASPAPSPAAQPGPEQPDPEHDDPEGRARAARLLSDAAALRERDLDRAVQLLLNARQAAPRDAVVRRELALLHVERGETQSAADLLGSLPETSFEDVKERARHLYVLGRYTLLCGRYADGQALFHRAAELDPKQAGYVAWEGASGDDPGSFLERARALDPEDPGVVYLEMLSVGEQASVETLRPVCERLQAFVDARPFHPFLELSLGRLWRRCGELDKALQAVTLARERWPEYAYAHKEYGWIWKELGEASGDEQAAMNAFAQADEAYAEGLKRFPHDPSLLQERIYLDGLLQRFKDLPRHADHLLSLPGQLDTYHSLHVVYIAHSAWLDVVALGSSAEGLTPKRLELLIDLRKRLERLDKPTMIHRFGFDDPVAYEQRCLQQDLHVADVLARQNAWAESQRHFEQLLQTYSHLRVPIVYARGCLRVERAQLFYQRSDLLMQGLADLEEAARAGFPLALAELTWLAARYKGEPVRPELLHQLPPPLQMELAVPERLTLQRLYLDEDAPTAKRVEALEALAAREPPTRLLAHLELLTLLLNEERFSDCYEYFTAGSEPLRRHPLVKGLVADALSRGLRVKAWSEDTAAKLELAERLFREALEAVPEASRVRALHLEHLIREGRAKEALAELQALATVLSRADADRYRERIAALAPR